MGGLGKHLGGLNIVSPQWLVLSQVLSFSVASQMGVLLAGVGTQVLHSMELRDLWQMLRGAGSHHMSSLSPVQRQAVLRKVRGRLGSPGMQLQGGMVVLGFVGGLCTRVTNSGLGASRLSFCGWSSS